MNLSFLTGDFDRLSLLNAMQIATQIMHQYALSIPKNLWTAARDYREGPFGPVEHLLHITAAEGFFRNWLSDQGLGTSTFKLPTAMTEAMSLAPAEKQKRLALLNQQLVINARSRYESLDALILAFSVSRDQTMRLLHKILESQFHKTATHPITNQRAPFGTVCYMIFAVHVMEHAFKLHTGLVVDQKVTPTSIYYDEQ